MRQIDSDVLAALVSGRLQVTRMCWQLTLRYRGTKFPLQRGLPISNPAVMLKRVLATTLWFLAAWELGSAIDVAAGMESGLLAPALALIAASVVALDPLRWFFPRPTPATARNGLSPARQRQTS